MTPEQVKTWASISPIDHQTLQTVLDAGATASDYLCAVSPLTPTTIQQVFKIGLGNCVKPQHIGDELIDDYYNWLWQLVSTFPMDYMDYHPIIGQYDHGRYHDNEFWQGIVSDTVDAILDSPEEDTFYKYMTTRGLKL